LDVDCNVSGYSYYNYPDISGTRVVYGMGYGCPLSWDIKSKELETGEVIEFGGGGVHTHPRIDGDIIVLYGGESSGDISAYDRSSISVYNAAGSTSQMTLRGYTATQSYSHPAIFGKKVVWLEHRNLDPSGVAQYYAPYNICGADITDLEHPTFFTIATNVGRRDVANRKVYGEFDDVVDISHNMVVWEGDGDIYGADISDLSNIRVFPICTHPARQFDPAIWNNIVVWTDQRNDEGDIYAADIRDTENIEIFGVTREAGRQEQPAIEGRKIAYVDFVNPIGGDIGEIKLCWLTEQHGPLKIPLAVPKYGVQPRIDRNTIIWMGEDDYAGWAEAISVEIAYSIADGAVENVTKQKRYDYIQHAIHQAQHDNEIVASEGVYIENINFQGKRLVVRSKDPADPDIVAATVISAGRHGAAVTFESSEGSSCTLRGFIIKGATLIAGYTPELGPDMGSGGGAIACFDLFRTGPVISDCLVTGNDCAGLYCYRSSPTVVNCAFAGNDSNGVELQGRSLAKFTNSVIVDNTRYGIFGAYPTVTNCTIVGNVLSAIASHAPNVRNSIVWDNASGDEQHRQIIDFEQRGSVTYSNVQGGWEGVGNIDADPCFVEACNGDYHLKSEAGRWDPDSESWVPDDVTSACIDKGDWSSSVGEEPYPNGGKINIGAYGGTAQASKSPVVTCWEALECAGQALGDATCDGRVDLADLFALKASFGLSKGQAGYNCCVDFTHDDTVDLSDLLTLKAGFGTSGYSPATRNQNCPP
jgi:beta propeller repeat protein